MELSEKQIDTIAANVADRLKGERKNRVISNEEHNEHHIFMKNYIDQVHLDKEAKQRIVESAKLWAVLLFLGFTAKAIWDYVQHAIITGTVP